MLILHLESKEGPQASQATLAVSSSQGPICSKPTEYLRQVPRDAQHLVFCNLGLARVGLRAVALLVFAKDAPALYYMLILFSCPLNLQR
jgi:hypothetical protein